MTDLQGSFVFDVDFFPSFFFICPPWGLMPNTCVALFSINICLFVFWLRDLYFSFFFHFFLFLTCITRIEGLSNLYCVAEILHSYSVRTGLVPKPSGWNRRSSAVCIKGERLVELLERGSPSA